MGEGQFGRGRSLHFLSACSFQYILLQLRQVNDPNGHCLMPTLVIIHAERTHSQQQHVLMRSPYKSIFLY